LQEQAQTFLGIAICVSISPRRREVHEDSKSASIEAGKCWDFVIF